MELNEETKKKIREVIWARQRAKIAADAETAALAALTDEEKLLLDFSEDLAATAPVGRPAGSKDRAPRKRKPKVEGQAQ